MERQIVNVVAPPTGGLYRAELACGHSWPIGYGDMEAWIGGRRDTWWCPACARGEGAATC